MFCTDKVFCKHKYSGKHNFCSSKGLNPWGPLGVPKENDTAYPTRVPGSPRTGFCLPHQDAEFPVGLCDALTDGSVLQRPEKQGCIQSNTNI